MTTPQDSEELNSILLQFIAEYHQGLNELAGHGTAIEQTTQKLQEWANKRAEAVIGESDEVPFTSHANKQMLRMANEEIRYRNHLRKEQRARLAELASTTPEQSTNITRLEVIDETGRAYVKGPMYGTPVSVELSYQDNGKTLKVFVSPVSVGKEDE